MRGGIGQRASAPHSFSRLESRAFLLPWLLSSQRPQPAVAGRPLASVHVTAVSVQKNQESQRDFPAGPGLDSVLPIQSADLILVWGTKIPHAAWCDQK